MPARWFAADVLMVRVLISGSLVLLLASGCGGSRSAPAAQPVNTDKKIVVTFEPMSLPTVLPSEACFVGVHAYDVMLFGVKLPEEHSCTRVADEVFPGAEQLPSSRDEFRNSDQVDKCELARGGGTLQVLRGDPDQEGPRFEAAYDLSERACERLEHEGWRVIFQEK